MTFRTLEYPAKLRIIGTRIVRSSAVLNLSNIADLSRVSLRTLAGWDVLADDAAVVGRNGALCGTIT